MANGARNGRIAARITYEEIMGYIGKMEDKNATFSASILGRAGYHRYERSGFSRLISRGVIKVVGKERSGRDNVYTLGEGMLAMGLDDILSLNYRSAVARFNRQ